MPSFGGPPSSRPPGGWPKTDLASTVQESLTKADESIPAAEKGAVNGVASVGPDGKIETSLLPDLVLSSLAVSLTSERPADAEVCLFLNPAEDPGTNAVAGVDLWIGDVV